MKTRTSSAFLFVALCTIAAPRTSLAGVKYWDNPDFKEYDVGDYVQDGLVLHYDGIRNVGADARHSDATDTWVNLASSGGYNMGWCSWIYDSSDKKYYMRNGNTSNGEWTENGFTFDGTEVFAATNITLGIPAEYTLQIAMTASMLDLKNENGTSGYIFRPGKGWEYNAVAVRCTANGTTTPTNAVYAIDRTRFGNNTTRANFQNATPRYATVLSDSAAFRIFETTEIPTAATGGNSYKAGSRSATDNNSWFAFGAQYDGSPRSPRNNLQGFNGTLHSIRYYSKALTYEDLAWNRVIDEWRFFNESAPIPVTNVIVATSVDGVNGDQPCGAYAINEDGYTFTAPAQRTVEGLRYVLGGYQLETWNGSAWSAPVLYATGSYVAAASGLVRLTWQYTHPEGEGKLVAYDESDYVTNGLVLHYDGICNVGAGLPHSDETTTWVNLASNGAYPLAWCSYVRHEGDTKNYWPDRNNSSNGRWVANGFAFDGKSLFATATDANFSLPETYTMQFAITADMSNQYQPSYLLRPQSDWRKGAVALNPVPQSGNGTPTNAVYVVDTNRFESASVRPNFSNANPRYVTVLGDNTALRCFEGTEIPDASVEDGSFKANIANRSAYTHNWLAFGSQYYTGGTANGVSQSNLQSFKGVIHSIRYYDRALSNEELEKNRKVDDFRFFGPTETTVVVQSTYSFLHGYDADGSYEVDGSYYTFVAPATVVVDDVTYTNTGYTVETQDGIGWADATHHDDHAYRYNTSAGTIRLTWEWKAVNALRTASDYDINDLSPAGLALHYDSIYNAGIDAARSTTATKWVNLGSRQGMDLTRSAASGDASAWGETNGYDFAGQAKFESSSVPWPTTFTAQTLVDAKYSDNMHSKGHYIAATTWSRFGMQVDGYRSRGRFYMQPVDVNTTASEVTFSASDGIDYMTVVHDGDTKSALAFAGVKPPTSGSGYKTFDSFQGIADNSFRLGGWGGGNTDGQNLVGTLYTFRYYDRVLTEEELVRNRNVDAVRYFGELGVTNMVVEVEAGSGITATPAAGAYFVEGSYDFSAERNGGTAALGYKIQEWDEANGEWVTESAAETASLSYSVASPAAAKKRLVWYAVKPFVLIVR